MTKLAIDGTSLEYVEQGAGDPLVLVHGSASDHRTWHTPQDAFGRRYRAIAYSRRYHWPNAAIPEGVDYAMSAHVDDLGAVLRSLGAGAAHVVGHSYGGFVALLLAIREPHLLRTLVLAEPPVITLFVSSVPRPLELLRLFLDRPRTALAILRFGATGIAPATAAIRRGDAETSLRRFGTAVLGRAFYRRLSAPRLEQARANFIEKELLGSGFPPLSAGHVGRVEVPALLVTGQQSPALFHRLTDRLAELLPDAERVEIPAASHIMHEDNPAAYATAVLSFLDRHPSPARRASSPERPGVSHGDPAGGGWKGSG